MLRNFVKPVLFALCSLPFLNLLWAALSNNLGPDPAEALADASGEWTLRLLLVTLAMTPLRQLTGQPHWVGYRRMLGLFTFFYAAVHMLVYLVFLLGLQWQRLWEDLVERPYIIAGTAALLLLLPLAITSTRSWQRRLGRRWKKLHRLVYVAAVVALLHLWWQVRSDAGEAWLYTVLFALLMVPRIFHQLKAQGSALQR